jgi:DNA modification methylase
MSEFRIIEGDCLSALARLPEQSVQTCVTSPPYWGLRDYGSEGQLGLEPTPEEYVANMVEVFREVRRVLRDDGTLWLNLGDSYGVGSLGRNDADRNIGGRGGNKKGSGNPGRQGRVTLATGLKQKDLVGIPWMVAFALRADGWYLRSDIIWAKPNPMPESVTDRPTKAHEYLFLLSKSQRYFYDADAIREGWADERNGNAGARGNYAEGAGRAGGGDRSLGLAPMVSGRNKRSVWTVTTQPFPGAHFATFPPKLIEPCILAGSAEADVVLDPFAGSGTTGVVALRHDRDYTGIELNPEYAQMARERIYNDAPLLNLEAA